MDIYSEEKPFSPFGLSAVPQDPSEVSLSPPKTRIIIKSSQNSPMLLVISSEHPKSYKSFSFTAGEELKYHIEKTNFKDQQVSKFELNENQAEVSRIAQLDGEFHQCRICFENDQQEDMISPCLCKGFQEFVHQSCLKKWLLRSEKEEKDLTFCEVCKGKFKMTFTYASQCALCSQNTFKFWVPFGLLLMIVTSILVFYLKQDLFVGADLKGIVFVYTFLGVVCVIVTVFMMCFIRTFCSSSKVVDWQILNYSSIMT